MKKVLFVCLGNICRSPLAEAIFKYKAAKLNILADSAGTAAYHIGNPPDHRSIKIALENGVPINHEARQFVKEDFERFDYVIAMDRVNYQDMLDSINYEADNIYLLREFDPMSKGDLDVPDPYYGDYDGFINIFNIISRSVDELIKKIEKE